MSNFKVKDKKIIPEFVGSLMKAIARRSASKAVRDLEKNPVIKKHIDKIKKIDKEMKADIQKRLKTDKEFKKDWKAAGDFIDSL